MRLVALLLALPLLAVSLPASPAMAGSQGSVEPPDVYLSGKLGTVTLVGANRMRIDPVGANVPDATGPEERTFAVELSRTPMRAAHRSAWQDRLTATPRRRHEIHLARGEVVCVRARQTSWGVTSAWSAPSCVVRPLDDRQVRRRGPVAELPDRRYADGHASRLRHGGRLLLPGVRKGARYGTLYTDYGPHEAQYCVTPDTHLVGQRRPRTMRGVGEGRLVAMLARAHAPGTAVFGSPVGPICRVGGVLVLPRWLP